MRRDRFLAALLLGALACATSAYSQQQAAKTLPPPGAFRAIALGMGVDDVKSALKADPLFRYRGDPDVSFVPQTSQYLIECAGATYIRRAYFQFSDGRLFIMILVLDPLLIDHYSLFSTLSAKYGPPGMLDPQESVWQTADVRFSLERPLTVKYVDNRVLASVLAKGGAQKDLEQLSREGFLAQF